MPSSRRKRRQLDPEIARGNAFPVAEIELAGSRRIGEIAEQQLGDRAGLQAVASSVAAVHVVARRLAKSAVEREHLEQPILLSPTIAAAIGSAASKPLSSAVAEVRRQPDLRSARPDCARETLDAACMARLCARG